jgi:glucose/arabinose dehydrogenase
MMKKMVGWGLLACLLMGWGIVEFAAAGQAPIPTDNTAVYLPILSEGSLTINFQPIATGLESPTDLAHAGDDRLFVALLEGFIMVIEDGLVLPDPFLDIHERVLSFSGEQGFLSLAFSPDYATSGYFFVTYTALDGQTILSRFQVTSTNPNIADPTSEQILLAIPQASQLHKGGDLAFSPLDGYLYVPVGDSGNGADAQNKQLLTGKLLRLDVTDVPTYTIPLDNPFVNDAAARDEIWALGLRNPWRISFDQLTGDLWITDVGQSDWEEVNLDLSGSGGGANYGWPCLEAHLPIVPQSCSPADILTPPIFAYAHGEECAITGGYRYRGTEYPGLAGHYLMADFCSGRFWSLSENGAGWTQQLLATEQFMPTTFGEDNVGRLYVASWLLDTVYLITSR